ncbi:MAG: riboflavin synthase [Alphaproteobacteria bacterium]|nr:riboflavin synthase [Alphaproteobacteria bacterium]MBV9899867.1 riboflavin synthase [Alphaproteobacteria bacterium]
MFTGIITDVGHIVSAEKRGDLRLVVACGYDMATVDLGASIACSGVCLTVVDRTAEGFAVDLSAETVRRSAPGLWEEGGRLNLERSLRLGDELGGHIVTGHVDGVGEVVEAEPVGDSLRVVVEAPPGLERFIAAKGSIAVDGVSLTVNRVDGARFEINLIPHTARQTTLSGLAPGRGLNLEIDILARYIGRMIEMRG